MQESSNLADIEDGPPSLCNFCQNKSTELDIFIDCSHHICPLCLYRRIFCENIEDLQHSDIAKIGCKCSIGYMYKNIDEIENIIQKKNEIDEKRRNEKNDIKTIPRCKIHPAQFLDYYCVECCCIICKICSGINDNDHHNHRIVKCSKIIGSLTNEIYSVSSKLGICSIDLFNKTFGELANNVKASAEKHFSKVVTHIEDLINDLIEFKNEYEANYKKELYRIVKTLKLYKLFYQTYYEDISEGANSNDINFMRYINNINSILSKGTIENNDEVCRTLNNLRNSVETLKSTVQKPITAKFDFHIVKRDFMTDTYFMTEHKNFITSMIQTLDEHIITCSHFNMKIWAEDTETSEYNCVHTISKLVGKVKNIFELKDERVVTLEEELNTIKVWEKSNTLGYVVQQTLSEHEHPVNSVSQMKDDRLISCGQDGKIIIWKESEQNVQENEGGESKRKVFLVGQKIGENDYPLNIILALHDNRIVTSGSDTHLRIWSEEEEGNFQFRCVHNLDANNNLFTSILQLKSGDLIMTIKKSGSLLRWKKKGKEFEARQRIKGSSAEVTAVTELRDARIATSSKDGMVRLFKFSGKDEPGYILEYTVEEYVSEIYNLKQLKDGRLCATGNDLRLVYWRSRNDMY